MGRWNPAKGNRKAGTKPWPKNWRSNKMVIPEQWLGRDGKSYCWYEDMHGATKSEHDVHGQTVVSLYQQPRSGFSYGCTPEDVTRVFNLLPEDDVSGIEIIAFRQSTRKQSLLSPIWGRLIFFAVFGKSSGTCLVIEATPLGSAGRYGRKQSVEWAQEVDRLRKDGHEFVEDRRGWTLIRSEESIRSTVLYRTVLHEVGHEVDLKKFEDDPQTTTHSAAWDAYWARPAREREDAAHRYTDEKAAELRLKGLISFAPITSDRGARQTTRSNS